MRYRCYVLMRRRQDFPIRSCSDVPLRRRRHGDVSSRRSWVFHLRNTCDVAETYTETSLRRHHNVLLPGGEQIVRSRQEKETRKSKKYQGDEGQVTSNHNEVTSNKQKVVSNKLKVTSDK